MLWPSHCREWIATVVRRHAHANGVGRGRRTEGGPEDEETNGCRDRRGGVRRVPSATIVVPTSALAQDTATIQGLVTDYTGGPIAGSTIQFQHFPTGIVTTTTSDAAGSYAQLLPTGVYVIIVSVYGYESLVFVLDVESDTVFNPG